MMLPRLPGNVWCLSRPCYCGACCGIPAPCSIAVSKLCALCLQTQLVRETGRIRTSMAVSYPNRMNTMRRTVRASHKNSSQSAPDVGAAYYGWAVCEGSAMLPQFPSRGHYALCRLRSEGSGLPRKSGRTACGASTLARSRYKSS